MFGKSRNVLSAVATSALFAGVLVSASATPSEPSSVLKDTTKTAGLPLGAYGYKLKAGPRLRALQATEFLGSFNNRGRVAYCVDYAKPLRHNLAWASVGATTSRWTATQYQQVSYVLNAYGNTRSRAGGAAVRAAINLLTGNVAFRADWPYYVAQLERINPGVVPLMSRYMNNARRYAGPHAVRIRITKTALVGQHGTAVASVTSREPLRRTFGGAAFHPDRGQGRPCVARPYRGERYRHGRLHSYRPRNGVRGGSGPVADPVSGAVHDASAGRHATAGRSDGRAAGGRCRPRRLLDQSRPACDDLRLHRELRRQAAAHALRQQPGRRRTDPLLPDS